MKFLIFLAILIVAYLLLRYWRRRWLWRKFNLARERYLAGGTFVVIDLETTGLEAGLDEITEIGAIKFQKGRALEEFSTLVNPRKPIPKIVQQKTGITTAMVKGAPRFEQVKRDLGDFIATYPLLGYNLPFDYGFLRKQGLKLANPRYDVLEIARLRLPRQIRRGVRRSFKLEMVAKDLGIPVNVSHRALDDARTTMEVFKHLVEEIPPS